MHAVKYSSDEDGKDALWYYVSSKSEATTKIFWVDYKLDADLLVHFVNYKSEAKWEKGHQLQNRL